MTSQFWEDHYGQREQIWSGSPNQRLVDEVAGLTPGTVLDLGCGEGADAVWLAENGWQVVAVDVSATALARAGKAAADRGVGDRIDWQRHDLGESFPAGGYDLVCASYLLSPLDLPRTQILRAAANAVRAAGVLLILSHAALPPGASEAAHHMSLPTPEEQFADLALPHDDWTVEAAEEYDAAMRGPDGGPTTRRDNILRLRRH